MFVLIEGRFDFVEIVLRILKKIRQKFQHATATGWIILVRRCSDRRFRSTVDSGRFVTIDGDESSQRWRSRIENRRGFRFILKRIRRLGIGIARMESI